ncbi:MAG: general secretion pathway protein GspB [Pseudomonadota bacterium]
MPKPAPAPHVDPDDSVPTLRELPEAIQHGVPPLVFGGYIYSSNPADRLLLIDKVLRHEGEEVAPGLTLERLLPKAALMNYKGYRYRVAY